MSRLRLVKVATPSNPPASDMEFYYDTAGPGYNTPVAVAARDENGNIAMLGHFLVLDYRLLKVSILTAASGTWTPTNGCRAAYVELWGGGGQGGGAATSSSQASVGGGGGGGGYAASWITGISATVAYVNGAGGTTGTAGNAGQAGADTTWGSTTVVAKGGSGGAVLAAGTTFLAQAGAAGGLASAATGDVKVNGATGGDGIRLSGTQAWSGRGGPAALLGSETAGLVIAVTGGTVGTAATASSYGSGGGGAATLTTAQAGGAGIGGLIRVWEFS